MKTWRVLDTGALSASVNIAIDQALLTLHVKGKTPPTLRFYQWKPPAISLGYFQKDHGFDLAACRRLGIEVIRRPTGGRAVLHLGDLTYAVVAGTNEGMPAKVTAAYRLLSEGLMEGFRLLGIDARMGTGTMKPEPSGICLLQNVTASIVYQERKFVGSAQTWQGSSMLQHGSIVLEPQIELLLNLWQKNADSPAELRANLETQITSIQEILGYLPEDKEIKTAIRKGMARTLGVEVIPGELTQEEWCLAREIADCEAEILRL